MIAYISTHYMPKLLKKESSHTIKACNFWRMHLKQGESNLFWMKISHKPIIHLLRDYSRNMGHHFFNGIRIWRLEESWKCWIITLSTSLCCFITIPSISFSETIKFFFLLVDAFTWKNFVLRSPSHNQLIWELCF